LVRTRKKSAQREDKIALKEAEMELKQGHAERALSLAERALFESIERTTGVKARGVMRHELAVVLSSHGLSAELAEEVQRCLVELETSRYGTEQRDAAGLLARVRSLIAQLPTRRGRAS
jgi:hypothetical protein